MERKLDTWVPARLDSDLPMRMIERPVAVVDTSPAWVSQQAAVERTSSTDRAVGLLLRLLPLTGLQLVLSVFLALAAGWTWPWGLVLWGGMASLTHVGAIWLDYTYSVNGLERHRIDSATRIQLARLGHETALRRHALREFSRVLEQYHGE